MIIRAKIISLVALGAMFAAGVSSPASADFLTNQINKARADIERARAARQAGTIGGRLASNPTPIITKRQHCPPVGWFRSGNQCFQRLN